MIIAHIAFGICSLSAAVRQLEWLGLQSKLLQGISSEAPSMGPYLLQKGSELWAPILKVVYNSVRIGCRITSTPSLPFKTPQIPSNGDHTALNRGTLGGQGTDPY